MEAKKNNIKNVKFFEIKSFEQGQVQSLKQDDSTDSKID